MAANIKNTKNTGYNNTKRQAGGFLNIYAPGATGRRKVGAIFLYDDDVSQAALMDYLGADPANAAKLHGVCEFEYNPNKPDEDKAFILPE